MTTLSGNIVPWLGSDVISNKYGNNGSQCCKMLGDLQGNLIRLCDRFEINSCPNCIYTMYSCLSDDLYRKVNATTLNQCGDLLQYALLVEYGYFSELYRKSRQLRKWLYNFLTLQTFCCLVCHLIVPHYHLSCISPCLNVHIVLLKIWKGKNYWEILAPGVDMTQL